MQNLGHKIVQTHSTTTRTAAYSRGFSDGAEGRAADAAAVGALISARVSRGFQPRAADLLTPPANNAKLAKGSVPTYGLTLAHADMSGHECCAWRGDCTKVCVISQGKGRYDSVRRAWLWRTDLFANDPLAALYMMGHELGRAVARHGRILFRPNVNSDLLWHRITPTLGATPGLAVYGYTKNPAVLETNGRVGSIRYAYSLNERSNLARVATFLERGGAVAVVSDRKTGDPVDPVAIRAMLGVSDIVRVTDADVTDEWLFGTAVVGDLSAKGRARALIGRSDFVRRVSAVSVAIGR